MTRAAILVRLRDRNAANVESRPSNHGTCGREPVAEPGPIADLERTITIAATPRVRSRLRRIALGSLVIVGLAATGVAGALTPESGLERAKPVINADVANSQPPAPAPAPTSAEGR